MYPTYGGDAKKKPKFAFLSEKKEHPTHLDVRMGNQTFFIFQARYLLEILWSTKSSKSSSYLIRAIEKWKLEHLAKKKSKFGVRGSLIQETRRFRSGSGQPFWRTPKYL